eukprot:Nk52_evm39s164 gene=Nk52_evmTU39s164
MDEQRALLDELMGRDRNRTGNEGSRDIHWSSKEVCKFYLCGFCPYDLFTNTKSDLGSCDKVHDDKLKEAYETSSKKGQYRYEEDFFAFLRKMERDMDKKIQRGYERLRNEQGNSEAKQASKDEVREERKHMLEERINKLLQSMEDLAGEGKIEESQALMKLVESLQEQQEELVKAAEEKGSEKEETKMEVCGICGALLVVNDAQERQDSHLQGKQHIGFEKIRNTLKEMVASGVVERDYRGPRRGGGYNDRRGGSYDYDYGRGGGRRDRGYDDYSRDRYRGDRHWGHGRRDEKPYDRYSSSYSGRGSRERSPNGYGRHSYR